MIEIKNISNIDRRFEDIRAAVSYRDLDTVALIGGLFLKGTDTLIFRALQEKIFHRYKQRELSMIYRIHQSNLSIGMKRVTEKLNCILSIVNNSTFCEFEHFNKELHIEDRIFLKMMICGYSQSEMVKITGRKAMYICRYVHKIAHLCRDNKYPNLSVYLKKYLEGFK